MSAPPTTTLPGGTKVSAKSAAFATAGILGRIPLYFLCGLESQKAANLALNDRVSLTIDHDTSDLMAITGLSMAAHAQPVTDRAEAEKVLRMLPLKYPDMHALPMPMPSPDQVRIFRVVPTVISVLDYSQGFGHTDLCTCEFPPISES